MPAFNTLTPQEIVAAPLTLYMAPIGTAFPAIQTAPSGFSSGWVLIGTSGDLDYDSTGLTVTHNQTLTTWTPVGSTTPNKVWRTAEDLTISVTLADTSADAYAVALNDTTVTTIAAASGVAGESDVSLFQGLNVNCFALLARGVSALGNQYNMQYQVPCAYQSANPAPVYKLGAPAELALTFSALLDPNGNGFGEIRQQSAAPTA